MNSAKILTINTYGGSLLLGARALGAHIIGSYEDCGFGSDIQRINFPDVPLIERLADWPDQNLSDVIVVAHPPCSAFSVQNSSWTARGENADAFQCTRRVLDYSMRNGAAAIAIESVVGALGGAWYVHQSYADQNGYHLYRILQNGCAFSAQWRERFWVVYIKKGLAHPTFSLRLRPTWLCVRDIVAGYTDGPTVIGLDHRLGVVKRRLAGGLSPSQMSRLFDPQDPSHTGGIAKVLRKLFWPEEDICNIQRAWLGNAFSSGQLCFLDQSKLAGVLLGSTWWYSEGRNLSEDAYKLIMGFPADYIFPESPRNFRKQMRMYLSKGVIPAVAAWVLGQVVTQLGGHHGHPCTCHGCLAGPAYHLDIAPNEIADFRFKRKRWMKEELPELRHYYEPAEWEAEEMMKA